MSFRTIRETSMKNEVDLLNLSWRRNPCARGLKKAVTIRLDQEGIEYFKKLGEDVGKTPLRRDAPKPSAFRG
jgi:hypothetical protein